jgi:beta-carotene 15,15'-dioxygenase
VNARALAGLLLAAAGLVALDHLHARAGLLVLVLLVASIGMAHGALDTLLLARHWPRARTRLAASAGYLLATVATALLLRPWPGATLLLLLALSVWHFGEGFELHAGLPARQRLLWRLLRGGAPVMLPALLSRSALQPVVAAIAPGDAAFAWQAWTAAARAWLLLACGGLLWAALRQAAPALLRRALAELTALAALYLLVSPLMAFALFFGFYHSLGHVYRVAAQLPGLARWPQDRQFVATLLVTALLGLALVVWMQAQTQGAALADLALRSVILALTAVSVPHVLLISAWAARTPAAR